jgi:hypothetical protein
MMAALMNCSSSHRRDTVVEIRAEKPQKIIIMMIEEPLKS